MRVRVLLPDARALGLDRVKIDAANRTVRIDVRSMASAGVCPKCGLKSRRIHSKYQRQLNDLPWQGLCVKVMWRSQKFFCKTEDCAQRIFTERLPVVAQPHARRTTRLMMALRCIAFACGGEEGSRLAERLSITISPDSLLRLIRKTTIPPRLTPRVLRVVFSHSRKAYSEVVYCQTTENLIRCLENAFWHFGGVPKTLVPDNLKAVVIKADWHAPDLNPKSRSFSEHDGTVLLLPTKPRTLRYKGKV